MEGGAVLLRMRIAELIQGLSIELVHGSQQVDVDGIVEDSRAASADCLFIARGGSETNGLMFIAEAVAKGAVAVLSSDVADIPPDVVALRCDNPARAAGQLAERFNGHPATALKIVSPHQSAVISTHQGAGAPICDNGGRCCFIAHENR